MWRRCAFVCFLNLEKFQEARFGGTRLSHHCHCSAEVVHILAVGVQHHGLGELLREQKCLNTTFTCNNKGFLYLQWFSTDFHRDYQRAVSHQNTYSTWYIVVYHSILRTFW